MDDLGKDAFAAAAAAIGGIVTGAMWLRSKLSRDRVQMANDHAEVNMLDTLQRQNAELRMSLSEVTQERNNLYREVGLMTGSIKALEDRQRTLEETINALRSEIGLRAPNAGGAA